MNGKISIHSSSHKISYFQLPFAQIVVDIVSILPSVPVVKDLSKKVPKLYPIPITYPACSGCEAQVKALKKLVLVQN